MSNVTKNKCKRLLSVRDLLTEYPEVRLNKYNILEYSGNKKLSINSLDDLVYIVFLHFPANKTNFLLKLKSWEPCRNLQGTLNLCFRRKVDYSFIGHKRENGSTLVFMESILLINEEATVEELYNILVKGIKYPQALDYLKEVFPLTIREWEKLYGNKS